MPGAPLSCSYADAARSDIDAIYRYIANSNPSAAIDVINAIDAAIELLSLYPMKSRRTRRLGIRALPLSRYPYIVFFKIRHGELIVLHVLHAARHHPGFMDEARGFAPAR